MASPWPYRQMGSQPRLPFPGHQATSPCAPERAASSPDFLPVKDFSLEKASNDDVSRHLSSLLSFYPGLLEEYVVENVRSENISRWLTKRKNKEQCRELSKSSCVDSEMFWDTEQPDGEQPLNTEFIKKVEGGNFLRPLFSLSSALCQITHSSGFNLYGVGGIGKTLVMYNPEIPQWDSSQTGQRSFLISKKTTVSGHVALTKKPICIEDVHMDPRFPKKMGTDDCSADGIAVLCLPVILPNNDLIAVVEFYRSWHNGCYIQNDLQIVQSILEWSALAIHKSAVCSSLKQQTEMNDFLLDVSRTYLDDITHIDNIIEHIMRFAKTLVSADRCTLFLYDSNNEELYSDLFDNGDEVDGKSVFEKRNEIRFHVSKGIAGYVASTKTVVNIQDAYADSRFNREVDKVTGYTTNNILCLPIMSESEVYGVVQMINKRTGGSFTKLDEDNFTMFAIFCALALRYSRIHAKLESEHNSHLVVSEQFRNSMKAPETEATELIVQITKGSLPDIPVEFERFQFSVASYDIELPGFFIHIVNDLSSPDFAIPAEDLARFTLAIRKNYRNKPYHNWKHAVTVAHCMYCILKRTGGIFSKLEMVGLVVACIAHDVDHRAFSNQYLQKIEHPLAALYPTSTMEQHHYQMLLTILNQEGHQIFSRMDQKSYDFLLGLMMDAILATDLALFFSNQRVLNDLLSNDEFDIKNHTHRHSLTSMMMTACDLCSNAKSWEVTKATVYDLYEEFWAEGDLRKKHGFSYLPMMDRDLQYDIPEGQVGFSTNVTLRCYETLVQALPECEDLLNLCNANLELWKKEAEIVKEQIRIAKEEADRTSQAQSLNNGGKSGLGVTLRGGMWVIEQSRLESEDEKSSNNI
uniref:cAMP and cAMP-inhibited cGMP 3',5'-cyclic phosphodiesterase 10A-like n=1 Tax=Styela clava TaxID=7725 RepID=UPI001939DAC8|nr:cAMP and cAMP-inhibited cGMP 3',5'-cyclic phosphodiesterase 10A-like [Styela clava]